MQSDYDKIREDNIVEYGLGIRHLSFLGRLYTDRTHFIFELLQNAEDATASKVLFQLFEDKLEVFHDGRLFNEKDVRGICGVGEGTKAEDLTQIGKFGIGFKSVYAYTNTPEIHSGIENFRIENYVRPYAVQHRDIGDSWTTLFTLPFNKEDVERAIACGEISTRLRQLSARTLLFLRNIKEIEYKLPDGIAGVYLRDEITKDGGREVTVIGQNNGDEQNENWLIFERPVEVTDPNENGPHKVPVEIAFRLENDNKDNLERIKKVKESPLVVFFPTQKETRLGFLIQGPYKTTPARDNIPPKDEWNKQLVKETAYLISDILHQFKVLGLLNVALLEALPIRPDDFPADGMFYPIYKTVRESLKNRELLPADDGSFVSAQSAKLASADWLRKLLRQAQFNLLYQKEMKWISGEITETGRYGELWKYIRQELEVEELTPDSFARKINKPLLTAQIDEWFAHLYRYLLGTENLWRPPRGFGDSGGILRTKPIIRLQDDSLVTPFRADGTTPNAFMPPPYDTDFPIVKRSIASDEQAGIFLKRLKLSEPDVYDEIVDRVLPKYLKGDISSITAIEHAADIQKIYRAITSDSVAGKEKVISKAKDTPFLKAVDLIGNNAYKKPGDVYRDSPDLRRYFSGMTSVWFLCEETLPSVINADFLNDLGIFVMPRRIPYNGNLPSGVREYSTRGETIEDYSLHGLDNFLSSLERNENFEDKKKAASILWEYLKKHLEFNQDIFSAYYNWFHRCSKSKPFDSHMLILLQNTSWIPTREGGIEKPLNVNAGQLLDEFKKADKLIDALGINQNVDGGETSEEDKKRKDAADILGVCIEDIEFLKKHPDKFAQLKTKIESENNKPEFPEQPVTNPERRKEMIEKQIANAPDRVYEDRERKVRVNKEAIDPQSWLRKMYTNDDNIMVCQICKEGMPFKKRNGEYYFEAVEAFTKDYFSKEHEAQYLALCPLCAAKYKELIKKDEDAIINLIETIHSMDQPEVPLSLGSDNMTVKFVGKHYSDIKTILKKPLTS